jgi:hypothetical protein
MHAVASIAVLSRARVAVCTASGNRGLTLAHRDDAPASLDQEPLGILAGFALALCSLSIGESHHVHMLPGGERGSTWALQWAVTMDCRQELAASRPGLTETRTGSCAERRQRCRNVTWRCSESPGAVPRRLASGASHPFPQFRRVQRTPNAINPTQPRALGTAITPRGRRRACPSRRPIHRRPTRTTPVLASPATPVGTNFEEHIRG